MKTEGGNKSAEPGQGGTLFDELLRLRDEQRERTATGRAVIDGEALPWEHNAFGKMRWYLHPSINDTVIKSMIFFGLEIEPGGKTGRVKTPGDSVILITQGRGYTEIDGVKHYWKAGDVIGLPIRPDGLVVQHFNEDATQPVRMVSGSPSFVDALGVDRGAGFEVLEAAPKSRT